MANKKDYKVALVNNPADTQLIVPASSTQSPIFDCGGCSPTGLILDGALTSCNISFLVSKYPDSGSFKTLVNFDGSAFVLAAIPDIWLPLLPSMFQAVNYFILEFSAAQTSGTNVDVVLSPIFQGIHA